jgi:hypothetical protein
VGESLWLNFTPSAPLTGIVLLQPVFAGPSGWYADPVSFLANATDWAEAKWLSQGPSGSDQVSVQIPPAPELTRCTGGFAPGTSATITWNSDVVVTHP